MTATGTWVGAGSPPPSGGTLPPVFTLSVSNVHGTLPTVRAPVGGWMHCNVDVDLNYIMESSNWITVPLANMVYTYQFQEGLGQVYYMTQAQLDAHIADVTFWWDHAQPATPYTMSVYCECSLVTDSSQKWGVTFTWTVAIVVPTVVPQAMTINAVKFGKSPHGVLPPGVNFMGYYQENAISPQRNWVSNCWEGDVTPGEWGANFGEIDTVNFSYTWTPVTAGVQAAPVTWGPGAGQYLLDDSSTNDGSTTPWLMDHTVALAANAGSAPVPDPTWEAANRNLGDTVGFNADSRACDAVGGTWVKAMSFTETHLAQIVYQATYGGSATPGMPVGIASKAFTLSGTATYNGSLTGGSVPYLVLTNWTVAKSGASTPAMVVGPTPISWVSTFRSYLTGFITQPTYPTYTGAGGTANSIQIN